MKTIAKILCAIAIPVLFSTPAFSLTVEEEAEFKVYLESTSLRKKLALTLTNLGSMAMSCPGGLGLTAISASGDTLPWFTGKVDQVVEINSDLYDALDADDTLVSNHFGGIVSLAVDVVAMTIDYADGSLEDGTYTKIFQNLRETYESSYITFVEAYSESGYCTDQLDRLGILLKLK